MATLEWRERVAPRPPCDMDVAPGRAPMNDQLKARLFGLATSVALLALFIAPEWAKRW
jgi:hypothetical protein